MEALVEITKDKVKQKDKELYHEFLVNHTNIFTANVYPTKDLYLCDSQISHCIAQYLLPSMKSP